MSITDAELHELYERYAHVIFHRALSILKNEELAHDAVHETFARVLQKSDEFRGQASPLTWMYRISTNYCLNQIRNRNTRTKKHEDHTEDIVGSGITPADEARGDHARILDLLAQVDDETRACVIHTFFDECTRQETADLVGLSVPTVRKRVQSFLDLARDRLGAGLVLTAVALLAWSIL
ncbi:MAG: sigma-70 family RNA polymerase sigma factor [Deltaproteobacteria bacterium]|nr:MAG: sigma-70 family RNA polymerase sigma factor [Deltaproteobacteria bacterium]